MPKTFVSALGAGISIGIGGVAYLSTESVVMGAFLFAVGLFTIVTFGFNLFTGKVCYTLENGPKYLRDLAIIWLGNFGGAALTGGLIRLTRQTHLAQRAATVSANKIDDGLLSVFILAVFCGMLIYIAVEGYKVLDHALGKYIAIFVCIPVFIISGFEHCIANMFFFTIGGAWSGAAFLHLAAVTLGNAVGGMALPVLRRLIKP